MEIIIRPPIIYPMGLTIIFSLIFLGIFTKWNYGKLQKNFSIIAAAAIFIFLFFISIQKNTVDIDTSGLKISGNLNVIISWDDVKSVNYEKNFRDAGYEPAQKKWGSNPPGHIAGLFQLANKKLAYCIVSGSAPDAIVIETKKDIYLLSFKNLPALFKEMSKYTMEKMEP